MKIYIVRYWDEFWADWVNTGYATSMENAVTLVKKTKNEFKETEVHIHVIDANTLIY